MKKELFITVFLGFIGIIWIFIVFTNKQSEKNSQTTTTLPTTKTNVPLSEVQKHNTANDCWIIINEKAYSVSQYLTKHPGGTETLIPYCGSDATAAYVAIKRGKGHSSTADQLLTSLFVGVVQ